MPTNINATSPASRTYSTPGAAALTPNMMVLMLQRRMADVDGQIAGMMETMEANTSQSEALQKQTEALMKIKSAAASHADSSNGTGEVPLSSLQVQWEGDWMNAADLLNLVGIEDLPANGQGQRATTVQINGANANLEIADAQARELGFDDFEALRRHSDRPDVDARLTAAQSHVLDTFGPRVQAARTVLQAAEYAGTDAITGNSLDSAIQSRQSEARRINSGNEVQMVQMQSGMQQRSQLLSMMTQMIKGTGDSMKEIARNVG